MINNIAYYRGRVSACKDILMEMEDEMTNVGGKHYYPMSRLYDRLKEYTRIEVSILKRMKEADNGVG